MTRARGIVLSLLLLTTFLAIYIASPVKTSFDSKWSIHTALSLAEGKGGDLREYLPIEERNSYRMLQLGERYYTVFPVGTSALAAPVVAALSWLDPDFKQNILRVHPDHFEKNLASIYAAIAALLFFWLIYSRFPSVPIALVTTAIFALGTSMWSTASRALWQHGPLVMMLVAAMLLLVRGRQRPSLVQYASIPLALAFIIRPTAAIPIAVLSAYVLIRHREWFIRYALYGIVIVIPWIAYNLHEFGQVIPDYYRTGRLARRPLRVAAPGNLFSPARGLFVYSPVLLLSLSGLVLALRNRDERLLSTCFGVIIVAHWLLVSCFVHWWGGHSYGPRFMTDIVPFLAYFVAFNFEALSTLSGLRLWMARSCIVLLAAISVVMHGIGAVSTESYQWNRVPTDVDAEPARLWDWRDPPFVRVWTVPHPRNAP